MIQRMVKAMVLYDSPEVIHNLSLSSFEYELKDTMFRPTQEYSFYVQMEVTKKGLNCRFTI